MPRNVMIRNGGETLVQFIVGADPELVPVLFRPSSAQNLGKGNICPEKKWKHVNLAALGEAGRQGPWCPESPWIHPNVETQIRIDAKLFRSI